MSCPHQNDSHIVWCSCYEDLIRERDELRTKLELERKLHTEDALEANQAEASVTILTEENSELRAEIVRLWQMIERYETENAAEVERLKALCREAWPYVEDTSLARDLREAGGMG